MKAIILIALIALTGCQVHFGVDYQGKTGVRDVRYSPESADDEGFQRTTTRKY